MPVRKPRRSYISVTGWHPSHKTGSEHWYEGPLERDYMILLDFDPNVATYECQPAMIDYVTTEGKKGKYTPDIRETYVKRKGAGPACAIVEVKDKKSLEKNEAQNAPKFAAGRIFAKSLGGVFLVKTEDDIRSVRLDNLAFLRNYLKTMPDPAAAASISAVVSSGTPQVLQIARQLKADFAGQAEVIATIWAMVVRDSLLVDLSAPLTSKSAVELPSAEKSVI